MPEFPQSIAEDPCSKHVGQSHQLRPFDNLSCPEDCQSSSQVRHVLRDATFEIISEMTKSANEEPGGVLRKRIRSNCVQPDDLRNSRQLS
eukprot:3904305-Pyramimonas_sp.AAC.1